MADTKLVDLEGKALTIVNRALSVLGWVPIQQLPAGVVGSMTDCVIAHAFAMRLPMPVAVQSDVIYVADEGDAEAIAGIWRTDWDDGEFNYGYNVFGDRSVYIVGVPNALSLFILHFDDGHFEHLIEGSEGDVDGDVQLVSGGSEAHMPGGGAGGGSGGSPNMLGGSEAILPALVTSP